MSKGPVLNLLACIYSPSRVTCRADKGNHRSPVRFMARMKSLAFLQVDMRSLQPRDLFRCKALVDQQAQDDLTRQVNVQL